MAMGGLPTALLGGCPIEHLRSVPETAQVHTKEVNPRRFYFLRTVGATLMFFSHYHDDSEREDAAADVGDLFGDPVVWMDGAAEVSFSAPAEGRLVLCACDGPAS
jgi:hypothetical protein